MKENSNAPEQRALHFFKVDISILNKWYRFILPGTTKRIKNFIQDHLSQIGREFSWRNQFFRSTVGISFYWKLFPIHHHPYICTFYNISELHYEDVKFCTFVLSNIYRLHYECLNLQIWSIFGMCILKKGTYYL